MKVRCNDVIFFYKLSKISLSLRFSVNIEILFTAKILSQLHAHHSPGILERAAQGQLYTCCNELCRCTHAQMRAAAACIMRSNTKSTVWRNKCCLFIFLTRRKRKAICITKTIRKQQLGSLCTIRQKKKKVCLSFPRA